MSNQQLSILVVCFSAAQGQAASVTHYWDFDTLSGGAPVDIIGGVPTSQPRW